MKVDITEVAFIREAVKQTTIKATDAHTVAALLDKLDKEFLRLEKAQDNPPTK
jgi:hypothetical protein